MSPKSRPTAFTLVELLVVVAIVVVLVAVSLPVLGKIVVTSRNLQCENNLHQIGTALIAHAGDHDGFFPTAGGVVVYQAVDPTTKLPGWTQQLEPYVGTDRKVFVCPSSHNLLPTNAQYSYFMACRAPYVANANQYAPVRLNRIASTSKFFIAGDIAANTVYTDRGALDADKSDYTLNPAFATMVKPFHNRRVNLVFADGHVAPFAQFDVNAMTVHYGLHEDGTGYSYSDQ